MNKSAARETSMDEILTSIRQIIADDDAALEQRPTVGVDGGETASAETRRSAFMPAASARPIVPPAGNGQPRKGEDDAEAPAEASSAAASDASEVVEADIAEFEVDADAVAPQTPAAPAVTVAAAAPLPDAALTADLAERLLEQTAQAAVRKNFARLNNIALGGPGITLDAMLRDMLRPMIKEWLDEHLPAVVERMVEKEIARISRGVEA